MLVWPAILENDSAIAKSCVSQCAMDSDSFKQAIAQPCHPDAASTAIQSSRVLTSARESRDCCNFCRRL